MLSRLAQKLRQLGDIGRDPPRLVFSEQLGHLPSFTIRFQSTKNLITHEPQANRTSITFEENPLRRVNTVSGRGSIWVIAAR